MIDKFPGRCHTIRMHLFCCVTLSTCLFIQFLSHDCGFAQDPVFDDNASKLESDIESSIEYIRDIQPILDRHCYECHGPTRQESNLRLDLRERAYKEADWGETVIQPGDSEKSLLIQLVSGNGDLLMPPEGTARPLSPEQIELLRRWIDNGADWPDEFAGPDDGPMTSDHWSFQPIARFSPPDVESSDHFPLIGELDRFILAKLTEHQLAPSPGADPRTLIRRLYLNMLGLLPSPEKVESFVRSPSPEAYEQLVNEVLASPHYGERWARHWLDVVRFGESTGYEVNQDRSNAFYYRDYVIESLNRDKSYRDFVLEQLAGDVVGVDEATGFLVGGAYDIVKSPDINLTLMQREDELADFVNTTSTTFLGLTVACARCHNHKFDPILQRDYFAMQAIFAGVKHGERPLSGRVDPVLLSTLEQARETVADRTTELQQLRDSVPAIEESTELLPMVNAIKNIDEFSPVRAKLIRFSIEKANQHEPCLDELEIYAMDQSDNLAAASNGARATSSGDLEVLPKHRLLHINDGMYGNNHSWIAKQHSGAWIQIELAEPHEIHKVVWGRDRNGEFSDRLAVRYSIEASLDGVTWQLISSSQRRHAYRSNGQELEDEFINRLPTESAEHARQLLDEIEALRVRIDQLVAQIPTAYIGLFNEPKTIYRLYRGDPLAPREEVPPDTLTLMGTLGLSSSTPDPERRKKFAEWIVSNDNPLTARVIVNRVWHYHFGRGLVWTTSDFGSNGATPSHPELLDWLAQEFMAQDWSLKWLHRQILLSSTFQQASRPRDSALSVDAEARFLWRFPPRRLEAEAIRDSVLQVSGKLNMTAGGPGFLLFEIDRENVHHYFPLEKFGPEHFRRMVYMTKIRQEQDDVFGMFDCPDGGQTIPVRNQSTTALQALNLLNSPFMIEQAEFFATRLQSAASDDLRDQVALAYTLLFSRPPTEDELTDAIEFIEQHGLAAFCRAMLSANEFLYLN